MADTGLKLETARVQRLADGRFLGQGFDLVVSARPRAPTTDTRGAARRLQAAFEAAYREKFSLTPPDVPVEFINIRVAVRAPVAGSEVVVARGRRRASGRRAQGTATRLLPRGTGASSRRPCTTARRLAAGDELAGPAVVEEEGSTLVVGPRAAAPRGGERQHRGGTP